MKDDSPAITALRWIGRLLPGDYLKTTWYLYCVAKPRKIFRLWLHGFYRMEHIYDVLRFARDTYKGRFTILEFGTNEGYSFTKMLYATRYLGMADRVTVHGFDTFQGMPETRDRRDHNIISGEEEWVKGQFRGDDRKLNQYCSRRYSNFRLHKGKFDETLSQEFLESLRSEKPILVWIDCDYYTSAKTVIERLLPYLPNGCVVYFDEYEFNFGSRFTGESRIVHEVNNGTFGQDIELVFNTQLSLNSKRIYNFVSFEGGIHYELLRPLERDPGRAPTNDSPLP